MFTKWVAMARKSLLTMALCIIFEARLMVTFVWVKNIIFDELWKFDFLQCFRDFSYIFPVKSAVRGPTMYKIPRSAVDRSQNG